MKSKVIQHLIDSEYIKEIGVFFKHPSAVAVAASTSRWTETTECGHITVEFSDGILLTKLRRIELGDRTQIMFRDDGDLQKKYSVEWVYESLCLDESKIRFNFRFRSHHWYDDLLNYFHVTDPGGRERFREYYVSQDRPLNEYCYALLVRKRL